MSSSFQAVKVTDRLYWVGAIDWELRNFHGYATSRGSTYNAYLLVADKVILFDTVRAPFKNEMLARIASVIEPSRIDYIVSDHSEMDHSAIVPEMIALAKPEQVIVSAKGAEALREHFHIDYPFTVAKDGERMRLGNVELQFFETKLLHWPDSMFTYIADEKVLISQDMFSMHLASGERFDDQVNSEILRFEAAKYYANILMPFSGIVVRALDKLEQNHLAFDQILTDHGPIWRKQTKTVLDWYRKWGNQERGRKAVVTYDTMWHSTEAMASAIAEGLITGGIPVKVMPLAGSHRSDLATEVLEAGALVVGSPTINNQMFPTVADALTYLAGLKPRGLIGAAFGSYGWSGESTKRIVDYLTEMKVELVAEELQAKYVPDEDLLGRCIALGRLVADKLNEKYGS
jgi:flavorubredoxin